MKLALYSHCAIDTIHIDNSSYQQIGGPACYGSLTARIFKFDVILFTKFGNDFPYDDYLSRNKILFENALSEKPTTRFTIKINGVDRDLFLENFCEPLEYVDVSADGVLISPIFHEISNEVFQEIKKNNSFVFIDPQGFMRRKDSDNKIFLENTLLDLSNVSAIKVSADEILNLTGESGIDGMKILNEKGVEHVLHTEQKNISLLVKDKLYSLTLPNKEIHDTTGIGDIFSSTFSCTMLKEKDFLWAFCFAGGAAQAALDSKQIGLSKIPKKSAVESNASYFYNTVKFKQV